MTGRYVLAYAGQCSIVPSREPLANGKLIVCDEALAF